MNVENQDVYRNKDDLWNILKTKNYFIFFNLKDFFYFISTSVKCIRRRIYDFQKKMCDLVTLLVTYRQSDS